MDLLANFGQGLQAADRFVFTGTDHIPLNLVSSAARAAESFVPAKHMASPHLKELAETALGIRKLKDEKKSAVAKLDAMQARVAKLEAERLEMRAYFEQQQALVEEQEELTQQLLEEQEAIDAEMACLLTQRNQIASERAQLIIEFSTLDGERADLAARELELSVEANELAHLRAGLEAARLDLEQQRAIFGTQDAALADPEVQREKLDSLAAGIEVEAKELDDQRRQLSQERQSLEEGLTQLRAEHQELAQLRAALDAEFEELHALRAELDAEVEDIKKERAAIGAQQEELNLCWARLDKEQSQMEAQQTNLDKQLAQIAAEWAQVKAEHLRLAERDMQLTDREAAVQKLEAEQQRASVDPFALKTARSVPLHGRQNLLKRGDSPRELEFWRSPSLDLQDRADHPGSGSSGPASVIDSLDEPQAFVTDSAASLYAFDFCRERAAKLKAERLRLWAATGNPEELDKMLRHLQEREAQHAVREMQLESREAAVAEQDRRFEAGEMVREYSLTQREVDLAAREHELAASEAHMAEREEEVLLLRCKVDRLKTRLADALASNDKALRLATRKKRSWCRDPDDSVLTPLRHRGLQIEDFYSSKLHTV